MEKTDEAIDFGPDLGEHRFRRGVCTACWAQIPTAKLRIASEGSDD